MLVQKITANFTDAFNNCVDRIVDALETKMNQRVECQQAEIFDLHKRVEVLERNNKQLETNNNQLNDKINQLNSKIETLTVTMDDLDQYSRTSNLLVHGVPSTSSAGQQETNLAVTW